MAFNTNSRSYEHVYGFELFDTIHNFFPEIMYDEQLFASDIDNWLRYRMSLFFPAMYSRQQNLYRLYDSGRINTEYNNWRVGNVSNTVIHSVPSQPLNVQFARPRPHAQRPYRQNSLRTQQMHQTQQTHQTQPTQLDAQARPYAPRLHQFSRVIRTTEPESLLISILARNDAGLENDYRQFADVNVVPTQQQIQEASSLQESVQIPRETVCAICQDHDSQVEPNIWRILQCSHSFHKGCVDHWFERNVHCPVCRADIRDFPRS
jgi:hypothetical protein